MLCLTKYVVKAFAKSKTDYETLLEKESKPDFRILLLGRDDPGKTAFLKQARKKYNGFKESECMEYKDEIIKNIYKIVAELVTEMRESKSQFGIDLDADAFREIVKESERSIPILSIPTHHLETIKLFWRSAAVKKCYETCTEANHGDYFLNNIARIANESYIPTVQDVMQVNTPTNAVSTQMLNIHGYKFEVTYTPAIESDAELIRRIGDTKYDFIVHFVSLKQFKTAKTKAELEALSENIVSIRTMNNGLMNKSSILLYFTHTQGYMHAQRCHYTAKNEDYVWTAKDRILRNFSRFIESIPNQVYNHFEDTSKLTNMKLVYELIKHQAIIKNLKQIHCSS